MESPVLFSGPTIGACLSHAVREVFFWEGSSPRGGESCIPRHFSAGAGCRSEPFLANFLGLLPAAGIGREEQVEAF